MSDIWTPEKRSAVMALVKGRGNLSTETRLAVLLKARGIVGWRRHWSIEGRPDFAFPKYKLAVFVDGDFWHGHPRRTLPRSNHEFWKAKISANIRRDRKVNRILRKKGWIVLRIWEFVLAKHPHRAIARIERALRRREEEFRSDILASNDSRSSRSEMKDQLRKRVGKR